jgi:hypothetical protein
MNPVDDPRLNFTVPQNIATGMRIPEFIFAQLISSAIGRVRNTVDTPASVVDKLFGFVPQKVRDQFKTWLRTTTNIFIDVSWPREGLTLPMIIVEPQSEDEDTSNTFLGDVAGNVDNGLGLGTPKFATSYAIPEKHTANIYVATDDDRLTLMLYTLVKFILVSNKDKLTEWYDIHNLSVGGQVLAWDEEMLPTFGYYRLLTARYQCLFDWQGDEETALLISEIGLLVQPDPPAGPVTDVGSFTP